MQDRKRQRKKESRKEGKTERKKKGKEGKKDGKKASKRKRERQKAGKRGQYSNTKFGRKPVVAEQSKATCNLLTNYSHLRTQVRIPSGP